MHLELEQFNGLLENRASASQRAAWTDHILDCPTCAQRYKFLAAFQDAWQAEFAAEKDGQVTAMKPAVNRRRMGAWFIAAAAIIVLGFATWLSQPPTTEHNHFAQQTASSNFQTGQVLAMVEDVNFKSAVQTWGHKTTALDLVHLKNRNASPQ